MTAKPKLYCSWFCPFAQRAWIGLLEKGIQFEYIEVDPYNKTSEWLSINPRGLVPVIVHEGKSICESGICLEYADEAWPNTPKLLQGSNGSDPCETFALASYERAHQRIWADHISKKFTPPFYKFLMTGDLEAKLIKSLEDIVAQMPNDGPFFLGNKMSFVDVMLIPFPLRFDILDYYRDFKLPRSEPKWTRFYKWLDAMKGCPSVAETIPDSEKLKEKYRRYAENFAESEVAEAIRKGTNLP